MTFDRKAYLARMANVPEDLRSIQQWVTFRAIPVAKKPGKTDKLPVSVHSGAVADAHDPASWCDFRTAALYVADHWPQVHGVGFVLTSSDPFVGIDLDNCIDDAVIAPWAEQIVKRLNSYTEITPSGKGLRIFVRGSLPTSGRRCPDVEMYAEKRFLTVTGNRL